MNITKFKFDILEIKFPVGLIKPLWQLGNV
ncbi:hypothetical protein AGR1A_Cc20811 [Agrobacterium fabacearum CFBP 5771]|nr:hypothetical protein AGR1B_Cc110022 [Agrobacterium fabacearum S56]CVI16168.1 hypothetical protein AGR1A_Cc20811 [Agrobacterium fabacearum CFBP 5771]